MWNIEKIANIFARIILVFFLGCGVVITAAVTWKIVQWAFM